MIDLKPPYRIATPEDAQELAELVNFAGEGLPFFLWQELAEPGMDPWEVGRRRQAEKAREEQVIVVDFGAGAVAALTGYAIDQSPDPVPDDLPAIYRPLQELENSAPGSWYVNVLACYPEHRGMGLGTGLLKLAEEIARAEGLSRMSIIVAGHNEGARRLYERQGYVVEASRPCSFDGWETKTREWVLLVKTL
ncbi:GNAT family N-acetyltransferase [Salipiger sp. PrR002]|uniref:GNAT family N-acetyltransferase n=1 Tax=Salipiger sp. PrR002 TaxID=2706489 RepID=UPI0013B9EF34|nr:GNAT family N-acetyltransferase [Salipiger sp. PrR002]NDV99984.1 GNAT family N-acetyltransferase [Salipiger sp. PrR002]NDW56223.1 GNAT family N-acetyltransferase [Salipiger sp. PrR004]